MGKLARGEIRTRSRGALVLGVLGMLAVGAYRAFFWSSPDPEMLSERARGEFMAKQYDLAQADLDRVFRLRTPTPFDWVLKALLCRASGKIDEALEALAKVPDDHSMAAQARMQAGQLEIRRNRFIPAEAFLRKALALDPKLFQARRELVYIYGTQLRRPELKATLRALSEVAPLDSLEVLFWCLTPGVNWDPTGNIEILRKCVEADSNDRWSRLGMAEALRELDRFDDVEAVLAPLPGSDPLALATRVRIALEQGDDQTADSLLAGGPIDNLELALLRGRFALAKGDGAEAIRQFRIAYNLAPDRRESVLGLGQALKITGDATAAVPFLEEARKHERLGGLIRMAAFGKNRDDPALIRELGQACADVGKFPEARAWYNLAISRDPLDTVAQQGLARVKEAEARAATSRSAGIKSTDHQSPVAEWKTARIYRFSRLTADYSTERQ